MIFSATKILKITERIKGKVLAISSSYFIGKVLEIVEKSSNKTELWEQKFYLFDLTKPSNILLWLGIIVSAFVWLANWILKGVVRKQEPSEQFRKIMKLHTAKVIENVSEGTFSWGYNYCIHFSKDPRGWNPKVFFVSDYDEIEGIPIIEDRNLPGYSEGSFQNYCIENPKVKKIQEKHENRERFSAKHIICNLNQKDPKVDVKLKKTSWLHLQYSWDYFRLLNEANNMEIVAKANMNEIRNMLYKPYKEQGDEFHINSFCLHLIIETKNGVILSRISKTKKNDYASTWAATLGEQIELDDFCYFDNYDRYYREDFVECWTKRALREELGILTEEAYESVVEPKSLKVLSIDMEADIYNVALTCVIRFKISLDEFLAGYKGKIDRLENFEFKECSLEEIRSILLKYPENQPEYHPSTYLRLLMFHRYKVGTNETAKLFCNANAKISGLKR